MSSSSSEGFALAQHGHPRFTKDADLWLRDSAGNIERAQIALRGFGAPPEAVDGLADAADLDVVWIGRPPNRIDMMKAVPAVTLSGRGRAANA